MCSLLAASPADPEQARRVSSKTDYDGSLKILQAIDPKDSPVHELIGQNDYMLADYKKAMESLDRAGQHHSNEVSRQDRRTAGPRG